MSKLSINKAISQGIQAGIHAVNKSSKHRCSNCHRTGHDSRKCPRDKKKPERVRNKKAKRSTILP